VVFPANQVAGISFSIPNLHSVDISRVHSFFGTHISMLAINHHFPPTSSPALTVQLRNIWASPLRVREMICLLRTPR